MSRPTNARRRSPPLALAAVVLAAAGAGCAVPGAQVRADIVAGRTPGIVVAGVPFVAQEGTEDCGAAALAAVLAHAGRPGDRDALEREIVRPSAGGSFTFDLALAANARGLHPWEGRRLGLDDLRAWLGAGRAPIVLLGVRPFELRRKHFAVVTGIDDGRGLVLLHDGADADRPYEVADFLERWERGGRFGLVAVPPEAPLPPGFPALDARARGRLGRLAEGAGHADAALAHYRAAAALAPSFAPVRANLGRLLLVQGRLDEAERELRLALDLAPADVRARNNLAHALVERALRLPAGAPRAAALAEAEALARAALAAAPADLVSVCRDTLARAVAARQAEPLAVIQGE